MSFERVNNETFWMEEPWLIIRAPTLLIGGLIFVVGNFNLN